MSQLQTRVVRPLVGTVTVPLFKAFSDGKEKFTSEMGSKFGLKKRILALATRLSARTARLSGPCGPARQPLIGPANYPGNWLERTIFFFAVICSEFSFAELFFFFFWSLFFVVKCFSVLGGVRECEAGERVAVKSGRLGWWPTRMPLKFEISFF